MGVAGERVEALPALEGEGEADGAEPPCQPSGREVEGDRADLLRRGKPGGRSAALVCCS